MDICGELLAVVVHRAAAQDVTGVTGHRGIGPSNNLSWGSSALVQILADASMIASSTGAGCTCFHSSERRFLWSVLPSLLAHLLGLCARLYGGQAQRRQREER